MSDTAIVLIVIVFAIVIILWKGRTRIKRFRLNREIGLDVQFFQTNPK